MPISTAPRVLHLIHTPRQSGAESLVRDLCLLHTEQGILCGIASFGAPDAAYDAEAYRLRAAGVSLYFPSRSLVGIARARHYRQARTQFSPDVIFAHSVLPSFYGRAAQPLFGRRAKFVTVLHDASNDDFAASNLARAECITRWRSDQVVAVSRQGADNYRRRFGGRPPVQVIPNGIHLDRFTGFDRPAIRAQFGLAADQKLIVQIGRLSPVKQQDLTIRALAERMEADNLLLWLAGLTEDINYVESLRRLVTERGLQHRVRLLGSRSDIPELLAASDLYVMPSTAESQGIALLEALASGAPVVASDIPAFDFCRDYDGVSLVEPKSEVLFLAAVRQRLSEGRFLHNIDNYSIHITAKRYADILTQCSR